MSKRIRPCQAPDLSAQAIPFKFTIDTNGKFTIETKIPSDIALAFGVAVVGVPIVARGARALLRALPSVNLDFIGSESFRQPPAQPESNPFDLIGAERW